MMDGNKIIDNITLYQDYHGYYPASLDSLNLDNEMINCENFEYRLEGGSLYVISFELWPLYRFEYRPQEDEWLKLYLQQVMLNRTISCIWRDHDPEESADSATASAGDDLAAMFADAAKFKEEFPKDRGKYYTSEQDHPGKKFSRKYIVHQ